MNSFKANGNETFPSVNVSDSWLAQLTNKPVSYPREIIRPTIQISKRLSYVQLTEISLLSFIFLEQTFIFLITFRKKSKSKPLFDSNETSQQRTILFPGKHLLYHCLHRNWIQAYSLSNISLSIVYFLFLILKHYYPNLLHHSAITFYSLPLTLVQQILINFSTFHLFIISISILQYFIRYYRLLRNKYSLNLYNGKNLLITKHTNVALILSGSLALIFAYNFIFYYPKHRQTLTLLPLITLNTLLLPLIDIFIFSFVLISCFIHLHSQLTKEKALPENRRQTSINSLRSAIERHTCVKCYSKFLKTNRNLLQDNDPYASLHSRYFTSIGGTSSARASITPPDDKRKYSTLSYENIPMISDFQSRLRASYPCQNTRTYVVNKTDFLLDGRNENRQNSANDLLIQTTLFKLKEQRSSCHLSYRLLLLFLAKYALLTFPQHCREMFVYLRQFYFYIVLQQDSSSKLNTSDYNEIFSIWFRFLFLLARCADSFLLTRLPELIGKYFPCWCQCNSDVFEKIPSTRQRVSHQNLMNNADNVVNEGSTPTGEPSPQPEVFLHDETQKEKRDNQWKIRSKTRQRGRRHYRVRFQFIPIWSDYRTRLLREIS